MQWALAASGSTTQWAPWQAPGGSAGVSPMLEDLFTPGISQKNVQTCSIIIIKTCRQANGGGSGGTLFPPAFYT
jgi:hypothetical protein